jgi:hypothetical protein
VAEVVGPHEASPRQAWEQLGLPPWTSMREWQQRLVEASLCVGPEWSTPGTDTQSCAAAAAAELQLRCWCQCDLTARARAAAASSIRTIRARAGRLMLCYPYS